jgi:hypothetical protein
MDHFFLTNLKVFIGIYQSSIIISDNEINDYASIKMIVNLISKFIIFYFTINTYSFFFN